MKTLLAVLLLTAPQARAADKLADEVFAGVERLDKELTSLQFDFVQTLRMTETGLENSIEGRLRYRKPDSIRLDYTKPRVQEAYANSKTVQVFTPGDNLVVKGDWEKWRRQQSGISHLLQFGDYASLLEKHKVKVSEYTVEGSTETLHDVRMTPKRGKDEYALRILFEKDTFLPRRTELTVGGSEFIVELSDVRKNPQFKDEVFDFAAPAGAQVVEFPGFGR